MTNAQCKAMLKSLTARAERLERDGCTCWWIRATSIAAHAAMSCVTGHFSQEVEFQLHQHHFGCPLLKGA